MFVYGRRKKVLWLTELTGCKKGETFGVGGRKWMMSVVKRKRSLDGFERERKESEGVEKEKRLKQTRE